MNVEQYCNHENTKKTKTRKRPFLYKFFFFVCFVLFVFSWWH